MSSRSNSKLNKRTIATTVYVPDNSTSDPQADASAGARDLGNIPIKQQNHQVVH